MRRSDLIKAVHLLVNGGRAAEAAGNEAAAEAFWTAQQAWRDDPSIVGFGVGLRNEGGQETDELVLKVYVVRKIADVDLVVPAPASLDVPGVAEPVPTDVDEIGELQARSFSQRARPVLGGMQIQGPDGSTGTLGCLVHRDGDPSQQFILTAAHVVGPPNVSRKYKMVHNPAIDASGDIGVNAIAAVNQQSAFGERFLNPYDAAIARVIDSRASAELRVIGTIGDTPARPQPGTRVQLCGAVSDHQLGTVVDTNLCVRVRYRDADGAPVEYGFIDQILCRMHTAEGDSGALVVTDEGAPVGINIAGTGAYSIASPLAPLLRDWGLAITTRVNTTALAGATPNTQPWISDETTARDVLARTVWGEAEGEGSDGQRAVAAVIVNRTKRPFRFGATVEKVCRQKAQFSCWNAGPRRAAMLAVGPSDAAFASCLAIADETLQGRLQDPTGGAEFYHEQSIMPNWAVGHSPCAVIGKHWFYNDVL